MCKAGQAELCRHHLLWAGAGKVQGGGKLIKLRQGAAGQGGAGGAGGDEEGEEEEEGDKEEGKHLYTIFLVYLRFRNQRSHYYHSSFKTFFLKSQSYHIIHRFPLKNEW